MIFETFSTTIVCIIKKIKSCMRNYLFCLLLILLSCNLSKDKTMFSNALIDIEVTDLDKDICISTTKNQYFKSFFRIQLESDTNMLIGDISKVILKDDRVYVMDNKITNSLFVFNRNGRFVNKINRVGQGPEEYIDLLDMFYDEYENTINILSWTGLIVETPVDLRFFQAERVKNGNYIFHSKNQSSLPGRTMDVSVYSKSMKRLYDGVPILPDWLNKTSTSSPGLFKNRKSEVFCTTSYTTDVYHIGTDSISLRYHYDFGKFAYPKEFNTPAKAEEMIYNFQINNYVTDLKDFYEGEKDVVSIVLFKGQHRMVLYNKSTKQVNSYTLIMNPLEFDSFGSYININNGYLIASVSAASLFGLFSNPPSGMENEVKAIKDQLIYPIKEEDNPVLYVYEFK